MDIEATLQRAIELQPGDNVAWLAAADWLEETGQADRAELLRLQVRLRGEVTRVVQRRPLEARLQSLLKAGAQPWSPRRAVPFKDAAFEFVLVPPGRFRMGSPARERGREAREGPAHPVTLTRGFWLGVTPVTQAQWEAVMGVSPPSQFRGASRPVESVSWEEVIRLCDRMEARTGQGFRLPTEAEWEYACRAGTTTAYCTGNTLEDLKLAGWCNYKGQVHTAPETKEVAAHLPNAFGLYDMHGQVWEWCRDWYGPYAKGAVTDPIGPTAEALTTEGFERVVRGGAWYFAPRVNRSAYRWHHAPAERSIYIGCRLVLEPAG